MDCASCVTRFASGFPFKSALCPSLARPRKGREENSAELINGIGSTFCGSQTLKSFSLHWRPIERSRSEQKSHRRGEKRKSDVPILLFLWATFKQTCRATARLLLVVSLSDVRGSRRVFVSMFVVVVPLLAANHNWPSSEQQANKLNSKFNLFNNS